MNLEIPLIAKQLLKIALLFLIVSALIRPNFIFSESLNLEQKCFDLAEKGCGSASPFQCRQSLEKCEKYYGEESKKIKKDLNKTEREKKTLQGKISNLNKKIQNLNYQIYQSNLVIKDLGLQIEDTKSSIGSTLSEIENSKEKLANILRAVYKEDQKPMVEILFSGEDISDFFDNLIALEILSSKNREILENIKDLKNNLENQKQSLDGEKDNLEKTVKVKKIQKEENAKIKTEQEYYWNLTEKDYQEQLKKKKETEKKAAAIRARIFELVGVPKAPTFGEALEIAKYVEKSTNVSPSFLLAILTQESNIGKNVGQCYLKNSSTGEGIIIYNGKKIKRVMKPSRDIGPFLKITKELGRDPYSTPVSCPMSYGYGGAMGPAQFIPSTWIIYKDKVKNIIGKPGDPWNIKDAFLAAALYLRDYGAAKQTYNAEWKAAMIYFSGTSKRTKYNGYGFYGDSVMKIASQYKSDIKAIR